MEEYVAETFEHAGLTVKIIADHDAESPAEWESPENGVFLVTTRNRYFEQLHPGFDVAEIGEHIKDQRRPMYKGYRVFRLTAYVHSGVALSLSNSVYPFNDQWDSGQIGWVLVKAGKVGHGRTWKAAEGLVKTWTQYLSGDVWGYVVESVKECDCGLTMHAKRHLHDEGCSSLNEGEHEDSCWGFYGLEYCRKEAMAAAEYRASEIRKAEGMVTA